MEDESRPVQSAEERATAQAEARTELAEYLDVNQQRWRLFPRAALVGLLAGIVGVAFRTMLAAGDSLRNALPGAPLDGKAVRELGLPPGCILVRIHDHGREWIPTANTQLEAHMRITAMIAP